MCADADRTSAMDRMRLYAEKYDKASSSALDLNAFEGALNWIEWIQAIVTIFNLNTLVCIIHSCLYRGWPIQRDVKKNFQSYPEAERCVVTLVIFTQGILVFLTHHAKQVI